MTIGSILLGLALLIVVILYVARPLLTAEPAKDSNANGRRQLEQEKESLLAEIRSLDFDYETGKIPEDVYEYQRVQLVSETAAVLKRLDDMAVNEDEDIRKQIEAAVAQRRHQTVQSSNGQGGYCHNCGQRLDLGDKFCASCGQAVRSVQPTT